MLHSWCQDVVTVTRAPWKNTRGTKVRDWDNATEHTVCGCSVQPATTMRDFADRAEQVTDRWTLYAPPCADLATGDRITCNGQTYEIEGAPFKWKSPTGAVSHKHANLVKWSG